MTTLVSAGAGFLLAVLWFDLMHDVQIFRHPGRDRELPENVLASISGYYRRVTTDARPMHWLVTAMMLATVIGVCLQIARDGAHPWVAWLSLVLIVFPILLAATHTIPMAVRLGTRRDHQLRQSRMARSILRDHLFCLVAVASLLTLQLAFA